MSLGVRALTSPDFRQELIQCAFHPGATWCEKSRLQAVWVTQNSAKLPGITFTLDVDLDDVPLELNFEYIPGIIG